MSIELGCTLCASLALFSFQIYHNKQCLDYFFYVEIASVTSQCYFVSLFVTLTSKGADNSTLYGCCVLVEELVEKPSGLLSLISDKQPSSSSLRRHILTTQRCYCILSRLPAFELHFGVLNR